MGNLEAFTGGGTGEVARQLITWGEAYGVNNNIQTIPLLAQLSEYSFNLGVVSYVAGEAQVGG